MARPKNQAPTYNLHKSTGLARCWVNGKWVTLGKYGSPESKAAHARILAELASGAAVPSRAVSPTGTTPTTSGLTIDQVAVAFWKYAQRHYRRPDGTPTSEISEYHFSLKFVHTLYGTTAAETFGPKSLAAVRAKMIEVKWCRNLINRRIGRVVRMFKWAAGEELVPVTVFQGLRTLAGLRRGRTEARESKPILPVDPAHVAATLPYLDAHLRTMVEVQRFTGMRPGEVCGLTFAEVDRCGAVWLYRPTNHKTAHHGQRRVIAFGPKAQAALTAFLLRDGIPPAGFDHVQVNDPQHSDARRVMADAYEEAGRVRDAALLRDVGRLVVLVAGCVVDPSAPVFSPAAAREERFRAMRAERKSKVQPSQESRKATKPKRVPGARFRPTAYSHAVARAADRAKVPHWHPNQLRHLFATEVRRVHGLEAAQVMLGHSKADVTQVYAERDAALAARVAADLG